MKADRHQCEGHAETYRKDRTAPFPVFHPAVVHNQSLDAVEQRLNESTRTRPISSAANRSVRLKWPTVTKTPCR